MNTRVHFLQLVRLQGITDASLQLVELRHSGLVVSKHGLNVGSLGSIPTAVTIRTAAGGDAEHIFLNH